MNSRVKGKSTMLPSSSTQYIHHTELTGVPIHRFAASFNMLSQEKLKALAANIAVPGQGKPTSQEHPIIIRGTLADGELLDGRNRLEACKLADVDVLVKFVDRSDDKAVELISSLNNQRRQQSHRELAESAWRYLEVRKKQGEKITQEKLAALFGIALRTLQKWRPGSKEAVSADAGKGNNNNRCPVSTYVRPVAWMLSELWNTPSNKQVHPGVAKDLMIQIQRMHREQFPEKY